jgi:chromate transporter
MALSIIYALLGKLGFVAAAFFGLKTAVLAIVLQAVLRVGKRALRNRIMQGLALAAFLGIFFFDVSFPLIILSAGLIGYFGGTAKLSQFAGGGHGGAKASADGGSLLGDRFSALATPSAASALKVTAIWLILWLAPVAALLTLLGPANVYSQIAVFFSKMAMVTFGGAYAVLAYVAQQAVDNLHWLQSHEMLDGLWMAETTPGPLIMVLQFVGFLAAYRQPGALPPLIAGALGGLLTTWVTFPPCFLWIFLGAPFVEKMRGDKALVAITAAVVGVILNLTIWFAIHAMFREAVAVRSYGFSFEAPILSSVDPWALLLTFSAAFAIFRLDLGVPRTLAICWVAGVLLYLAGASPATGQTLTLDHQSFASKGERLTDAPIGNVTK